MTLPASIRLLSNFDVDKLVTDLEAAQSQFRSAPQVGSYHDGSWTGIALRAINGDYKNTLAMSFTNVDYTEVVDHCPYFKEILETLPFPVGVARILFLPPGKKIGEHTDKGFSWEKGHVRLHIPIITDPKVHFQIGQESVHWPAGQFWFGDFNQPHKLHNESDITRVHIVLDCFVTGELLSLFPENALQQIRAATTIKTFDDWNRNYRITDKETYTGYFKAPKTLSSIPLYGVMTASDTALDVRLFGLPFSYRFSPKDNHRFQGLYGELVYDLSDPQTRFRLSMNNSDKEHQGLILKQLPPGAKLYSFFQSMFLKGGVSLTRITIRMLQFTKRLFKTA